MLLRHAMSFEGGSGPLVSGKAFIFGVTGTNNCPNYFGHDMATAEWDTKGLFHSVTHSLNDNLLHSTRKQCQKYCALRNQIKPHN